MVSLQVDKLDVRPHVSAEKPPATIQSPRHKQAAAVKKGGGGIF